jgi:KDO2-lipid IV(A) lauroyltransferase
MRNRRRFATRNLELCLPELDAAARATLLRANFRSLGTGTFEFMRAWWGALGKLPERSSIRGIEHLEAANAAGRGVLMLSGHFHSFELCGRLLTTKYAAGAMYRPHAGKAFDWAVRRGRARYADALFERDEIRPAIRYLRKGGVLWYAPDQDMRGRESVFAPFFGVSANTITGTRDLARVGNAAVVPFKHRRKPDGSGYEIELLPALENFPSDDATLDAARINAVIEELVRYAPDEYLWIHRRFKRRPEGEPKLYD